MNSDVGPFRSIPSGLKRARTSRASSDLTWVHALPRPLMSDVIWKTPELAVTADHEDMIVGDGAEGLVFHGPCERGFIVSCFRSSLATIGSLPRSLPH